jgi:hypothetical protein
VESVEKGPNAEKDKTMGRTEDGPASASRGGEANAVWVGRPSDLQRDEEGWFTMRHDRAWRLERLRSARRVSVMASARKASANGKNSAKRGGVQGRNGRGPIASAGAGADQAAGVSAGERLDEGQAGASVGHDSVVAVDAAVGEPRKYFRLRLKAEAALELLVTAPGVPANVRASAVRTALELVGAIGARSKDQRDQEDAATDLDPERLSVEDIDREIAKLGRV